MFEFDEPYQRDLALIGLGILVVLLCVGAFVFVSETNQSTRWLTVDETDTIYPTEEVVAFESMTPAQQRTFKAALADPENYVEVTNASTKVWEDHRAVRYENRTYEVEVAVT
ncbi:hypothetical protein [Salinigranum salinum]|uniref:hypothetical protein n=1 Tax=Salinigranum salinum TaxID=1364937 RepID=UPI0012610E25|nr:hypothetical protein [Salinigranum salinum]